MKAVENRLFSSARKGLKVWDLGTMECVSEMPDYGIIKAIAYWKERNLLLTAAEKSILLWDTVSLTNVGSVKVPNHEIRALEVAGETN
jgi:WD40 repeat protein